ncbi:3',5'-cyclic-nucleotide phosphodiesterase regA [Podospora aff. communis PSN243]|uniref:Phosphodiesterase n=1 Tax=Podospora aff. communis PSN243 TaxID=3040156 RepID=A0AAV9H5G3_9PEZI|nr:3',5'-cyclic-nucleotide phosphodiesterase regA [Podospora aff. communis PSN243]
MENASCNVIYVDRAVSHDRYIRADTSSADKEAATWETPHIAENVRLLLDVFGEVHLCSTGGACLTQWLNLQDTSMVDLKPTIILIDTPYQERIPEKSRARSPSPHSPPDEDTENHEEELYGLALLQRIISESYLRSLTKLVLPVPIVVFPLADSPKASDSSSDVREEFANAKLHPGSPMSRRVANRRMLKKCLDLGAIDVMASPMNGKCITNLEVHAYRAHREAARDQKALLEVRRGRKRSWVGISEEKPFAYLREAMVSNLMNGICRIENENDEGPANLRIWVPVEKQAEIAEAVGRWHFCAHSFTDDELIIAAAVMFDHALAMPELEAWRLPTDQLHSFVVACRAAYNGFVPYHNFRHVVDVLQATFHFLVRIGALPPFPAATSPPVEPSTKSPISALLKPFDALTMLITAIGHDVGHPGVNNGFLVTLNAPLAQLYNDRSVLESFHCAAYSQILRRHWPAAFGDSKMRNLMISSILATDMGLHFDYMKKLADLQDKLRDNNNSTDGWNGRMLDEQKALACALLIKCADISNVARRHDTALKWMHTLADEFSRQAIMETELGIPSSLMAPPKKDMLSLGRNQMGFMSLFAIPLFQGVADILPAMQYCVDELELNKGLFERTVASELEKGKEKSKLHQRDESLSPKTLSFSAPKEAPQETSPALPDLSTNPGLVERSASDKDKVMASNQASSTETPADGPKSSAAHTEPNGIETTFDTVADFARSDPFSMNSEEKIQGPTKQRCSETTEGSSAPYSGDWASQATSATTGKMPLSPSTQGTSIVSRDSLDRPTSVPVTTITAPESIMTVPESTKSQPALRLHRSHQGSLEQSRAVSLSWGHNNVTTNGMAGKGALHPSDSEQQQNGRTLKKKGSRFRINPLPFIRRHLSSSPPLHAADTAG